MKTLALTLLASAFALSAHAFYPEWLVTGFSNRVNVHGAASADFNGDGRSDLVLRVGDTALAVMLTDSQAKPGVPATVYSGQFLSDVVTGDFDGDGKADIVAADIAANALVFLHSRGDGTFDTPVMTSLNFAPTQIAAADFDGDGHLDLAVRSLSGAILAIERGDGSGHFAELSRSPISSSSYTMAVGDIDGDHHVDVLIGRSDGPGFDLFFGKGDGTFDPPVPFTTTTVSVRFVLADLNGDGRAEIVSGESNPNANTLTVRLNLGSRNFAAPVMYAAPPFTPDNDFDVSDVMVAEVNGDGIPDVVVSLLNSGMYATFPGHGDGTLGTPVYAGLQSFGQNFFAGQIVEGDFNGDGESDMAVVAYGSSVGIYANTSGQVSLSIRSSYPVISAGTATTFQVQIQAADGYPPFIVHTYPTGTVTLKNGDTIVGTGTFENGFALVAVQSLPAGMQTIVAQYDGDSLFHAGVSPGLTQKVVADKTVTTLTNHAPAPSIAYGTEFQLTADVQSPIAGSLTGSFSTFVDGAPQTSVNGPPGYWSVNWLHPGTHTFYVQYNGNLTQPPSTSNVVTEVIKKAPSRIAIDAPIFQVDAGKSLAVDIDLTGPDHAASGGMVTIYEGTQPLLNFVADTRAFSGGTTIPIRLPAFFDPGPHVIHATYAGDADYEPSVSADQTITVLPATIEPSRHRTVHH